MAFLRDKSACGPPSRLLLCPGEPGDNCGESLGRFVKVPLSLWFRVGLVGDSERPTPDHKDDGLPFELAGGVCTLVTEPVTVSVLAFFGEDDCTMVQVGECTEVSIISNEQCSRSGVFGCCPGCCRLGDLKPAPCPPYLAMMASTNRVLFSPLSKAEDECDSGDNVPWWLSGPILAISGGDLSVSDGDVDVEVGRWYGL